MSFAIRTSKAHRIKARPEGLRDIEPTAAHGLPLERSETAKVLPWKSIH
jgi:hypothetical protein